MDRRELAGGLGFEPRLAESESAVLPLDDPPSGKMWPLHSREAAPVQASHAPHAANAAKARQFWKKLQIQPAKAGNSRAARGGGSAGAAPLLVAELPHQVCEAFLAVGDLRGGGLNRRWHSTARGPVARDLRLAAGDGAAKARLRRR